MTTEQIARKALDEIKAVICGVPIGLWNWHPSPDADRIARGGEAAIERIILAALATEPRNTATSRLQEIRASLTEHIQKELRPGNPMLRFWRAAIDETLAALATGRAAEEAEPGLSREPQPERSAPR